MDDIDLIRDFGAEFRGPDAEESARVREAMMGLVQAAGVEAATRRPAAGPSGRAARGRAVRRRWLVASGIVAAVVAAAVIIPGIVSNGPLGGVQTAAAEALTKVAGVAADQKALPGPSVGQFVYTKTKAVYTSGWYGAGPKHDKNFTDFVPWVREAWIGPDGSGRLLETYGTATFVTAQDRAAWIAAGRPDLLGNRTSNESYAAGGLSYVDLTKLPTDPAQLRRLIVERKVEGGPAGDAETFTIIGDLLRETYAPPALRAALYQIASQLPGIDLIGTVNDDAGRTGTAVGYTSNGYRQELIFDPSTSALLGERSVITDPAKAKMGAPAGTVIGWATYLTSGIVNSTSARP